MPATTLLTHAMVAMTSLLTGPWTVVDDVVMGGRSASRAVSEAAVLRFEGRLSLENNGGFGSIRAPAPGAPPESSGVRIRARGDGRTFQLRLRQGRLFDGVAWRVSFQSQAEWQELEFAWSVFEPVFRGRPVPGAGPLDPQAIGQVGFLIADGQAGTFRLEVAELSYY